MARAESFTVQECTREELEQLKIDYYEFEILEEGEGMSCGEISDIDNLVSDETVMEFYADYTFTDDDFWCNAS